MGKALIIAIDGPAGVGKGTAARILARRLGFLYVDSGGIYRALAWLILRSLGGDFTTPEPSAIEKVLRDVSDNARFQISNDVEGRMKIHFDTEDLTGATRNRLVEAAVPHVARISLVRDWVTQHLRSLGENEHLVIEGRDIGTVVFPAAQVKFYLDASTWARAQRRYLEYRAQNISRSLDECRRDLEERDRLDRSREVAPLKAASDAIALDTTKVPIDSVVNLMEHHVRSRLPSLFKSHVLIPGGSPPQVLIAVSGPIGVGKTTLCSWLKDTLNISLFAENPDDNPFIRDYYSDQSRWAFQSQMWFLWRKYELLTSLRDQGTSGIIDRTIHEDYIFAKVLLEKRELELYERWYSMVFQAVPEPNLIISLEASVDSMLARIRTRDRDYERKIHPELLEKLHAEYQKWIESYSDSPVIRINTEEEDVRSEEWKARILLYLRELMGT